jgi:signal transduction histidine kinase
MTGARRRRSLFWTITGIFLLTTVLGSLVQGLVAVAVLRPLEIRETRARAELAVSNVANAIAAAPHPPRGAEIDSLLARQRAVIGRRPGWIIFRGVDGSVASDPPGAERFLERSTEQPPAGTRRPDGPSGNAASRGRPSRHEVIARRPVLHGSTLLGEVQVVHRMRPRGGPGDPGARAALLFLPIAIVASAAGGLVMLRLLVRRLRAMEVLAARVAEGDLGVRVSDRSGDEIGRVAEQLDRMTERLAEARLQLQATEQQRRQLFADITHELATPLTSIRGAAETLLDPQVPMSSEERTRYMRGVLDEAQRLDRLIRDLFELARLEAGATPLVREPLDWSALVRHTIERFEPRFTRAGLRLVWRQSVNEAWIEADGRRIEQVLENLLVNALRYVPEGGNLEIELGRSTQAGGYRLTVSDDGPGLPAGDLPHLFERFYRGSAGRAGASRDTGGSGLGLAIAREIVERHGGSVHAKARAPHGLMIAIELPEQMSPESLGRIASKA